MILVGSPIWTLLMQSDTITWAILITLFILSLISWSIALHKIILYRAAIQSAQEAFEQLRNAPSYETGTMRFATQSLDLVAIKARTDRFLTTESRTWSYETMQLLRDSLYGTIEHAIEQADRYSAVLRVASEVSPLLGLLGTIWGLIHSFVRIAAEKSADIATVAPGIAEALVTTLMGLFVAIPALLFFHTVQRYCEQYEQLLIRIADTIVTMLHTTRQ